MSCTIIADSEVGFEEKNMIFISQLYFWTVVYNCISPLYFSTVFLNCISQGNTPKPMLYSVAFTIPFITMVVTDIAIYFKVTSHYHHRLS